MLLKPCREGDNQGGRLLTVEPLPDYQPERVLSHTGIIAGFHAGASPWRTSGTGGFRGSGERDGKKAAGFCGKERLDGAGGKCYDTDKLKIPNQ